ncbi:MAG: M66 family metalloprotease [Myxococcales bacterium]
MNRPLLGFGLLCSFSLACSDADPTPGECHDCTPQMDAGDAVEDGGNMQTGDGDSDTPTQDAGLENDAGSAPDAGHTWPTGPIRPRRFHIADPTVKQGPCANGGNGSLTGHEVLLGQTHLTPKDWPFQTVSAQRPLTVAIAASGNGAAPSFQATVQKGSDKLVLCLEGPSTLPADASDLEKSLYRTTLPAAWVVPGISVRVEGPGVDETLTPSVQPENGLTVYYVQAKLFGAGDPGDAPSDAQWTEFLARLPVSFLDVGVNPFGVWQPEKLLLNARDDGRTPNGDTTSHPAIVIDENPHCSNSDKTNGTCTTQSGYGVMAGVLNTLDTFREANGVGGSSTWFAYLAVALGGGLAGGQRGTGDDADLTMNHELGHAWGFPHWAADDTEYPYEGVQRDRGGFGDRWGFDQARSLLLSPLCKGLERQSPMQRAGSCVPQGSWYDPYSDYEAMRLLRMNLGASQAITGNVPYHGGTENSLERAFTLQKEDGRGHMEFHADAAGFTLQRFDESTHAYEDVAPDDWNRVLESEVPVTMFAGALIMGGENFFEKPVNYVGNVLAHLNPTVSEDYAYVYAHRSSDFYWASDLMLRFTLDDQTSFTRMYGGEAKLRAAGDLARFAFNLPQDVGKRVTKLEILSRPLGQYDQNSRLSASDSASNYLQNATVLATWKP